MKTMKYLSFLFCLLTAACFDDDTKVDTVRISEIVIDTLKLQKEYNIEQNEVLELDTREFVTQTEKDLDLSYEWLEGGKPFSDSSTLRYATNDLGIHRFRLRVSNAHGSSFYQFQINVLSAYEKGITILSADADGRPMLSIMRELSDSEIAAGAERRFLTDCLEANNPDAVFPRNPTDLLQRERQLYISFTDQPSIYMLNSQKLNIENIVTDSDPDFCPVQVPILDAANRTAPVLTESHKVFQLASIEGILLPYAKMPYRCSMMTCGLSGWQNTETFWDEETPAIRGSVGGWNFYSSKDVGLDFTGHEAVYLYEKDKDYFTMITKKDGVYMKTTINNGWMVMNWDTWESYFDVQERQVPISGPTSLCPESPAASCSKYAVLFYAEGNRIYRYYYNSREFSKEAWKTVDRDGAEITALAVSPNQKELYVGVHRPGEAGRNGSLYVLDTDTGSNIEGSPYMNVAYRPVKIIYKKR